MAKDDVLLLLEQGGKLKTLEIDFWEISLEVLQAIMEKCTLLEGLRVLVDAPFTKVLNIPSSTYANLRHLRPAVPQAKDFRKALKKSPKLQEIVWTGRGGVGRWELSHPPKGSLLKVAFVPLEREEVRERMEGRRRGSEASSIYVAGMADTSGSSVGMGAGVGGRRRSSVSSIGYGSGWRKNRSLSMSSYATTMSMSISGEAGTSSPEKEFSVLPQLEEKDVTVEPISLSPSMSMSMSMSLEEGNGNGNVDGNGSWKEDKTGRSHARRKSSANGKERVLVIGQQRGRN
ncbi:hypothetical protein BT69DRAFT_1288364 [Atractiella rhizophila]|nr:hypothetical protein BT69DRAFT_1288364 [Atractiella rhizophila]